MSTRLVRSWRSIVPSCLPRSICPRRTPRRPRSSRKRKSFPMMKSWKRSSRRRRKRQKVKMLKLLREQKSLRSWRSESVLNWSTRHSLCGPSIPMSARRKSIWTSTARYFRITRSLCSGSTWTWIILSIWRVFCTSRRSIWSMSPSRVPSSCTTIRYLLQIISRKSFQSSCCC